MKLIPLHKDSPNSLCFLGTQKREAGNRCKDIVIKETIGALNDGSLCVSILGDSSFRLEYREKLVDFCERVMLDWIDDSSGGAVYPYQDWGAPELTIKIDADEIVSGYDTGDYGLDELHSIHASIMQLANKVKSKIDSAG